MEIVYYPDPVLQRRAAPVTAETPDLPDLVAGMFAAMEEAHGVGLAAPQVGVSLRLFIAHDAASAEGALVCVNPTIEPFGPSVEMEEGCLSLPGLQRRVSRPQGVRATWTDLEGVERTGEFHELMARIIQHEFDHLEGVLFFERMSPADRMSVRDDLKSFEEQYRPR